MISCCMTETTIGIIIGSMFTLLGVIINGVITFIMSCSSHNREVEEHKRCEQKKDGDTKRAKREMAYRGFVNYYGLMNLLIGFAYASNDNEVDVNLFREIFAEEFKKNLAKSSEVISRTYETINNIEAGEYGYTYDMISVEDLESCLSDMYKFLVKDKINN